MSPRDCQFVDYARGDVRYRNNVVPIRDALADARNGGSKNSYITVFRFPAEYREHVERFGSVGGYAGPAYADYLPFDIDREGALHQALLSARALAIALHGVYGLREDQVRYFFSGAKGFHLLVPTKLMGTVEPSPHLPAAFRAMARSVAETAGETIDAKIYDTNRLFRLPDTQHPSGLWKVELTWAEFSTWTVEQVRELARQGPRRLAWEPHDLEPVDALVEFYAKHIEEAEAAARRPRSGRLASGGEGTAAQLAAALEPAYEDGRKHNLVLAFAGYAAKRHLPRETAHGVVDELLEPHDDPSNLHTAVDATYDRVRAGHDVAGYRALAEIGVEPDDLARIGELLGDRTVARSDSPADVPPAAAVPEPEPAPAVPAAEANPRISLEHVFDSDRAGQAYLQYVRELAHRRVHLGIPTLDEMMRGLMPGTVTMLLAKARVGKSMFAQHVRRHVAHTVRDGATVFFSLEMPVELVWERDAQHAFALHGRDVESQMRHASDEDAERYIAQVSREIPRAYTVPVAGLSLADMRAYCRLIEETFGHRIACVLIDYLSLVSAPGRDPYQVTSAIARGLKPFAKELRAPVVMLAQVRRRGAEGDKIDGSTPPSLEDGRDSGAIEEGADYVIGAWRPKIEDQNNDNEIGFKLLKNRMGAAGREVFCRMDWRRLSITELMPDEYGPSYTP
jgi:hypothetical protein